MKKGLLDEHGSIVMGLYHGLARVSDNVSTVQRIKANREQGISVINMWPTMGHLLDM